MVRIRLRRVGARNQPSFRIVASDKRSPRDGRFLEILGHYNPRTEPATVEVDEARLFHWLQNGAQASSAVHSALAGIGTWERWEKFKAGADLEALAEEAKAAIPDIDPRTRRADFTRNRPSKKKRAQEAAEAQAPAEAEAPVEAAAEAEVPAEAAAEAEAPAETTAEAEAPAETTAEAEAPAEAAAEAEAPVEEAAAEAEAPVEASAEAEAESSDEAAPEPQADAETQAEDEAKSESGEEG